MSWKKNATKTFSKHIDGYQIQWSKKKNFSSGNKSVKVKGYKKTSYKAKKLSAKTKYYVRVRTYSKYKGHTYYSKWSKVKSVVTK